MLYANDAGIVSQSLGSFGKMTEVTVKRVHGVRPLTVSEVKAEIMRLHGNKYAKER